MLNPVVIQPGFIFLDLPVAIDLTQIMYSKFVVRAKVAKPQI